LGGAKIKRYVPKRIDRGGNAAAKIIESVVKHKLKTKEVWQVFLIFKPKSQISRKLENL